MKLKVAQDNLQVESFVGKLPDIEYQDYCRVVMRMSDGKIREVNAKRWRGKIFEVYFKRDNRLFYIIEHGVLFLLYACGKTKGKTTSKDSKNIMRYYKYHRRLTSI